MSWLIEQTPSGRRGRALSLRLAGNRLRQLNIPTLVGGISATLGSVGSVFITAAIVVLGTVVLMRGVRLDFDDET